MGIYEDIFDKLANSEAGSSYLKWYEEVTRGDDIDASNANYSAKESLSDVIESNKEGKVVEPVEVTVTKMVPVNPISQDIQDRVMRVEGVLAQIAPKLNGLNFLLKPSDDIKIPEKIDGFLDKGSLASYQGTMKHLNFLVNRSDGKDQKAEYVAENSEEIVKLLESEMATSIEEEHDNLEKLENSGASQADMQVVASEIGRLNELKQSIPSVMADIAFLHKGGHLSNVVAMKEVTVKETVKTEAPATTVAPKTSIADAKKLGADNKDDSLDAHVKKVENVLFLLGNKIKDFDKMGLSGAIITPLTEPESKDGKFDAKSQDMLAKAIVLIKTMEGESNPNGEYSPAVGQQLKRAILTNPSLEPIRDAIGISIMDEATQKDYYKKLSAGASDAEKVAQAKRVEDIDKNLQLGLLNDFVGSLDKLNENQRLDTENKAKSTTKANIIMDGIHEAMKKWAPGFIGVLKDFFQGEIGQMIAPILAMFGVNVNRLWGDKNDMSVEDAKPMIGKGFDLFYDDVAQKLGANAEFKDIMAQTKVDMNTALKGNYAFDKAMDLVFKGKGDDFIQKVVERALDEAEKEGLAAEAENKGSGHEAARNVFSQYIVAAGQKYSNGQDLDIKQINSYIDNAVKEMKGVAASDPNLAVKAVVGTGVSAASGEPSNTATISANEKQNISLIYTPDNEAKDQDPLRLSSGRVAVIQEYLHLNSASLGLNSVSTDFMMNKDGEFTDSLTRETSALIEENWLRANVYALTKDGKELTQGDLDKIAATKLTGSDADIEVLRAYADHVGADMDGFDGVKNSLASMSKDMRSLQDENATSEFSVLEQALLWDQLNLKLEDLAPKKVVEAAPLIETKLPERSDIAVVKPTVVEDKKEPCITKQFNAQSHSVPYTFKDLRSLKGDNMVAFQQMFKDKGVDDILQKFEKAIRLDSGQSKFVFLELTKFDINHPNLDVVVAMRDGDNIDYRYVNKEDFIMSLHEHRLGGYHDLSAKTSPASGPRRFDDFMDEISRSNGGGGRQGAVGGFAVMTGLVPNGQGGVMEQDGLSAAYGRSNNMVKSYTAYSEASYERYNARTSHENNRGDMLLRSRIGDRMIAQNEQRGNKKYDWASPHDKRAGNVVRDAMRDMPGIIKGPSDLVAVLVDKFSGVADVIGGAFEDDPNSAIQQNIQDMGAANDASMSFGGGSFPKFTGEDPFDDGNNAWSDSNKGQSFKN